MFNNIKDTRIGKFTTTCLKRLKAFGLGTKDFIKDVNGIQKLV